MNDFTSCPICGNSLRKHASSKFLFPINKFSHFIEKICSNQPNHLIQFFIDSTTNNVDFVKMSLNHLFTKYIEIDFVNQKSTISIYKQSVPKHFYLNKIIEPDFPKLTLLKEKVDIILTFS